MLWLSVRNVRKVIILARNVKKINVPNGITIEIQHGVLFRRMSVQCMGPGRSGYACIYIHSQKESTKHDMHPINFATFPFLTLPPIYSILYTRFSETILTNKASIEGQMNRLSIQGYFDEYKSRIKKNYNRSKSCSVTLWRTRYNIILL